MLIVMPEGAATATALNGLADDLAAGDATLWLCGPADATVPPGANVLRDPAGDGAATAAVRRAFEHARSRGVDVLFISPGFSPRPGMISALAAAADNDVMIGFAVPRLVSVPGDAIASHHPAVVYLPGASSGVVLIRAPMLGEFGPLDDAFSSPAGAVADLAARANRCGYRSVRVNQAIAIRPTVNPCVPEDDARLSDRHPSLVRAAARYRAGPVARAERLAGALAAPGRRRVLFDCRAMHPFYSGTCEHSRRLLAAFVARHGDRYECHALIPQIGWHFHRLGELAGLVNVLPGAPVAGDYAVAFRLSQPFDITELCDLVRAGAVAGALILDTIALDCQHLDDAGLETVWRTLSDTAALIGFNSRFSANQFIRRFPPPPATVTFVSLCSTEPADYALQPPRPSRSDYRGILLVGNHHDHKAVDATADALERLGAASRVTVFGIHVEGMAAGYHAGSLPQTVVDDLYDAAGCVLFPSHYEGFGLPIMQALARGKPVVARDLPCAREIAARSPHGNNIHFAGTVETLASMAAASPAWDGRPRADVSPQGWNDAADDLAAAFDTTIERFDIRDCVARVHRIDLLEGYSRAASRSDDGAET